MYTNTRDDRATVSSKDILFFTVMSNMDSFLNQYQIYQYLSHYVIFGVLEETRGHIIHELVKTKKKVWL